MSNRQILENRPGWRNFFISRLLELLGSGLLVLAFALFLALITIHNGDPGFTRASGARVGNIMGPVGAYVADIGWEGLGLAALLLPFVPAMWGAQLLRHRLLPRWWARLLTWPIACLSAATTLAVLPFGGTWPFTAGLGGFAGRMILTGSQGDGGIAGLARRYGIPALAGSFEATMAVFMLAITFPLLYATLGLHWRSYVSTGRAVQKWLSAARAGPLPSVFARRAQGGTGRAMPPHPASPGIARPTAAQMPARRPAIPFLSHLGPVRRDTTAPGPVRQEPHLGLTAAAPVVMTSAAAMAPSRADQLRIPEPVAAQASALVEPPVPPARRPKRARASPQPALAFEAEPTFQLPPLDFLALPKANEFVQQVNAESLEKNARLLETVLDDFGVKGQIVKVRPGPVVTLYELEPAPGTKTSRVVSLADDIARSMAALSVRIAVVPGRSVIGIELPNAQRETVSLRELLDEEGGAANGARLALALGKDIGGQPMVVDLARMPHLLIAGTTGSGKSVAINTMILSLLYRLTPDQCKFIMIDPKMLELSVYDGIPHLLAPVVTEPRKAIVALKWVVREMENRYRAMSKLSVRNIDGFNQRVEQARREGESLMRKVQTGFDPATGKPIYEEEPFDLTPYPYIVVIVDEMADLMLVAGKDIEAAIQRLAQMARAAGIHLVMATQRPSVDVITGTIKANFPTRISFHVTTKIDSRTILGDIGAEQLLGQGDMLYMANGGRITRVHGPFVSDREVESIVQFLKAQGEPAYLEDVTEEPAEGDSAVGVTGGGGEGEDGQLYDQAVAIVVRERKASTSFIQRHLQIGYNRAARLIERMEKEGIVSSANHAGKREILAPGGQ
ncbi:MAG TPA: DNA translocase FtsK 4TM domain-containing protein [Dongiaceae bacterium]|jgi:S-DNA-T family DNA segregation ATPase FtsK/SpoIIIE|nr:DNA translocase FtsK 4TM domain-containing protein [Dongiaceae bacterium]